MADRQRLFVDMDGTLAVFTPVDELETLYEQGYFANLVPHENVVAAVQDIIKNHPEIEVHILSAYLTDSKFALQEKNEWLDKYLPEVDREHRVFVPCGSDKKDGIEGGVRHDDFLLDDYTHNLNDWQPPARGIKLLNAINHTRGSWEHDRIRFDREPSALAEGIVSIMQGKEKIFDERINEPMEQREKAFIENLARLEFMRGESVIFPVYEPLSKATNPTAREVYQAEQERLIKGEDATRIVVLTSEMVGVRDVPHDIAYNRVLSPSEVDEFWKHETAFHERLYAELGNRGAQPSNYYGHSPSVGDAMVVMSPRFAQSHYVASVGFEREEDMSRVMTPEQQRAAMMGLDVRSEWDMLQEIDQYARSFGNENLLDAVTTETMGRMDFLRDEYTPVFNLAAIREVLERDDIKDKLEVIATWQDSREVADPFIVGYYDGEYAISRDSIRAAMPDSRLANGRYVYDDARVVAGERLEAEINRRFEEVARDYARNNSFFYRFEASPTPLGEQGQFDAFVQMYERTDGGASAIPRDIVYIGEPKMAAEIAQHLNTESEYSVLLKENIALRRELGESVLAGNIALIDDLEHDTSRLQERKGITPVRAGEGIKVDGHVGTWHIVDQTQRALPHRDGEMDAFYLLEHDTYGEDAAMLIVNKESKLVMSDVYNGFDDLDEAIENFAYSLQELESAGYTVIQVTDTMGCELEDNDTLIRGFANYDDLSDNEMDLIISASNRVTEAMKTAGYEVTADSTMAKPSYSYDGQAMPLRFENLRENVKWLDGVVFDDPEISDAVERIMHPSRFEKTESNLSAIHDVLNSELSYRYQFIDRLRSDCDYYLGYGNRNEQNLWAKNVTEQISYMKAIWDSFSENEKPEWISYEDILRYEREMTEPQKEIVVAIESTDDYTDPAFHAELVDTDVRNADGSYGRMVDYYRIVTLGEDGKVVPYDNAVYNSAEEARASVAEKEKLKIISYDSIIDEAWKNMGQRGEEQMAEQNSHGANEVQYAGGEAYRFFYDNEDNSTERKRLVREEGWKQFWGSDEQGLNGGTWVVYRDVADLPNWLQNYAREMEQYQPMPNRYYEPELDLDGTADELFTQARNGYIESPEALAKLQEILSNPVENKTEQAFYVGVLKEIAENEGNENQAYAQMKKDILDGVHPEELTLRDGLTLEVLRDGNDSVVIDLRDYSRDDDSTFVGGHSLSQDEFLKMSAQDIKELVNSVYYYNMNEAEREEDLERPFEQSRAFESLAERIDEFVYRNDPYEYGNSVGSSVEERSAAKTEIVGWLTTHDEKGLQSISETIADIRDGLADGQQVDGNNHYADDIREANDILYSLAHLEQYEKYFDRETPANAEVPVQEFRGGDGRIVEGNQIPMVMSQTPHFSDRSIVFNAVQSFETDNHIPENQRVIHDGVADDKEFVYGAYDKYIGMSHQNDLSIQQYMERISELTVGREYQYASPLPMVAEVYYAQQNGLSEAQIDYALEYVKEDKYPADTFRNIRHGLESGLSVEQLDILKGEKESTQEYLLGYMASGGSLEDARALKGCDTAQYYLISDPLKKGEMSREMAQSIIQSVNGIMEKSYADYKAQHEANPDAQISPRFGWMDSEFFTEYFVEATTSDKNITPEMVATVAREFMEQTKTDRLRDFIEDRGGFAADSHGANQKQERGSEMPVMSAEDKEAKKGVSLPEEKKDPKEQLTEKLQQGIKEVLNSENFKNWLDTSSKLFMNNYSFNNAMLVWLQRPDASHTMGYEQWKDYGRNVAQGAQGIKIFVPVIAYEKKDGDLWRMIKNNLTAQMKNDPSLEQATYRIGMSKLEVTMNPNGLYGLRVGGTEQGIRSERDMQDFIKHNVLGKVPMYFSVGTVFDAKDTVVPEYLWVKKGYKKEELVKGEDGKPIKNRKGEYKIVNTPERQARFNPTLDMSVPQKDPVKMAILYDALKAVSERNGIPVYERDRDNDDTLKGGADGYYSRAFSAEHPKGYIVMPTDLDKTRAVSVMLHEMAHSELHGNLEKLAQEMGEDNIPRKWREIQAEAVAYTVGKQFGIDTETSSFQYLAAYTSGFELQALSKSIEVIYKECQQISKELESELALRGLNRDLSDRFNTPMEAEAVETISKAYAEYAVTQTERIGVLEAALPALAAQNAENQAALSVVVEQANNLDRQKENVGTVQAEMDALQKADSLDGQKEAIARIEAAKERIEADRAGFDELSAKLHDLMKNDPTLQNRFATNPTATLESMKQDYPQLEQLTGAQIQYLAKSEYVSRELAPLLKTDPQQFVDKAVDRATQIDKVASKNGIFVEVAFCEQWTDKPIVSGGALMHPKVADTIVKQAEMQIRGLKAEAENNGDYFPYSKCALTVFQADKGQIASAFKTRVDIGDGSQGSLADHLKQFAGTKNLVADFEKATREKGAKEKILFNADSHGANDVAEVKQGESRADRRMSREEWAQEIGKVKEAEQDNGSRTEQEQTANRSAKNNKEH